MNKTRLIILLTIYFLGISLASFASSKYSKEFEKRSICSKELEEIVYISPTAAYNYLKKINKEFKTISPLFWSDPALAKIAIRKFRAKYPDIIIQYLNAMGQIVPKPGDPGINVRRRDHSVYQAYGIGQGYQVQIFHNVLTAMFVDIYWNPSNDGQMYTVIFNYPLTNFYF